MWASPHSSHPLVAKPIGIFATCERGGFLFQRASKPAKKLIAQNPPKDDLPTRATSGLVFARQAAAADVTGGDSRWQQAGNRSKAAWLVTRQNARLSLLLYSVARGKHLENSHRQVGSARASPLAICPVAGQPHSISDFPKNGEKCEMRVFRGYGTRSRAASRRRNTHCQGGSAMVESKRLGSNRVSKVCLCGVSTQQ